VEGEQREGEKQTQADVALFFVTYVLINSVMMLNVVVAVLLDEFLGSVARDKEERERLEQAEKEKLKVTGCLDELTLQLINFIDDEDLGAKIASIYHQLDADASGGLSFDEFKAAVKGLVGHVHLTRDDFDELRYSMAKHLIVCGLFWETSAFCAFLFFLLKLLLLKLLHHSKDHWDGDSQKEPANKERDAAIKGSCLANTTTSMWRSSRR